MRLYYGVDDVDTAGEKQCLSLGVGIYAYTNYTRAVEIARKRDAKYLCTSVVNLQELGSYIVLKANSVEWAKFMSDVRMGYGIKEEVICGPEVDFGRFHDYDKTANRDILDMQYAPSYWFDWLARKHADKIHPMYLCIRSDEAMEKLRTARIKTEELRKIPIR